MPRDVKKISALIIAATMIFSSFAFFITGFRASGDTTGTQKLDSFVVNYAVDSDTESAYMASGFTFMKLYYGNQSMADFSATLPDQMTTVDGRKQLVVELLRSNETYAVLRSAVNATTLREPKESSIMEALCSVLVFKPSRCLLPA
ncbi:MAG: hypothetical protein HY365_01840 [Candidatus Aenigmarchaeota archaeon]|nr:hypothetical protein [Candidatus Aenigmarchaeota archaeon]